jgi:hypothetical protein
MNLNINLLPRMKNLKTTLLISIFILCPFGLVFAQTFQSFNYTKNDVQVTTESNILIVKNKQIERQWKLTDYGLATVSVQNLSTKKVWQNNQNHTTCDWSYNGLMDGTQKAKLISITANESTDEGFTDMHTEIVLEFEYPESKVFLKYVIWVYPNTQGIRTQSFIKGSVSQIQDTKKNKSTSTEPFIRLKTGTNVVSYSASEVGLLWHASYATHPKSVEYQVLNLDPSKKYKVGISWWDFDGLNRQQQVRLTSVDGESDVKVIEKQLLPNYKVDKKTAQEFIVDVPVSVLNDGSFRLYVDNMNQAKDACVSEIWLYEEGEKKVDDLQGEEVRIKQIKTQKPEKYSLVSYFDCGEKNPDEMYVVRGNVDYLPLDASGSKRIYAGYFNDTQHRNSILTPILKEEIRQKEIKNEEQNWWASILALEQESDGIMMVKESHKCVNQYGVETGSFVVNGDGIFNTGTSIAPEEIVPDTYKWFWGSWIIPYQATGANRELSLKSFDRKRFPVNVKRDMYSLVCTWGHSRNVRDGRNYATESEVLKEMDFVKEINVDLLLIDDGWQISKQAKNPNPDEGQGWKPAPSVYTESWKKITEKAKQLDLKLGLWGVAQQMPTEDMTWNWDRLKMNQLKLDFASFGTHDKLDTMMESVRSFMKTTNHQSSISWDLTENAARYGYYWAREYGNLHFMNRKPFLPLNVLYVPHLALRDYWLLSRYSNLNKYQLTIQHAKASDKQSDAYLHSETYCVATGLMGVPEFMAMPRFYQPVDRKLVGNLMKIYKTVQKDIFTGFVFPIGNEPDNKSWTGFQSVNQNLTTTGYLTIFRELNNTETNAKLKLRFLKSGQKIELTNIQTKKKVIKIVDENDEISFFIQNPADFLFLKWRVK